jgi:exodeoxyribonuclease-3
MLKIATWNINSLRVRLPQVLDWAKQNQPDLLALQETKLEDDKFPQAVFEDFGYHVVFAGQKTYNGVAILSRSEPHDVIKQLPRLLDDAQKRFIGATYNDIRVVNLYIPNGESVGSEKYAYKMRWLEQLEKFLIEEIKRYEKLVILGDFNIAPEPRDVYDASKWEGHVLFSEPERAHFKKLLAIGFFDALRLHSQAEDIFSWWDYRTFAFPRNAGLRIDHILVTSPLAKQIAHCYIDIGPRAATQPSDHAPVVTVFEST